VFEKLEQLKKTEMHDPNKSMQMNFLNRIS